MHADWARQHFSCRCAGCAPLPPLARSSGRCVHVVPVVSPACYAVPSCPPAMRMSTVRAPIYVPRMRESKLVTFTTRPACPAGLRVELKHAITVAADRNAPFVQRAGYRLRPVHLGITGRRLVYSSDGPTRLSRCASGPRAARGGKPGAPVLAVSTVTGSRTHALELKTMSQGEGRARWPPAA
jgi:hypothetical protein